MDAFIAATANVHDLALVTRNERAEKQTGVGLGLRFYKQVTPNGVT